MEALVQFGTKKLIITFDNVEEIKNAIEERFPTLKQLKYRIQVYNSTFSEFVDIDTDQYSSSIVNAARLRVITEQGGYLRAPHVPLHNKMCKNCYC